VQIDSYRVACKQILSTNLLGALILAKKNDKANYKMKRALIFSVYWFVSGAVVGLGL
jgi:hypothetical protein